jgi:hypothetical protein
MLRHHGWSAGCWSLKGLLLMAHVLHGSALSLHHGGQRRMIVLWRCGACGCSSATAAAR